MAKKKANKNRSVRERVRWQEEMARREEKRALEENKTLLGCLAIASVLLAVILIFA